MKLEFVNHSSFVADTHGVRLICDPWIEGLAFNKGWDLLAKTRFGREDFGDITHIWFSHEHPDHFHPPNLLKIPEEYRRRITVLFQTTRDKNVVSFCTSAGFKQVIELGPDEWHELAPGLTMMCRPLGAVWGEGDSWMCLKTGALTVLNINDCEMYTRELAEEARRVVGSVDVLATQFSYAAWQGNADNVESYRRAARNQLEYITAQIEVLEPRFVIPFASFVWFCHEENFFMNEGAVRIGDVEEQIRAKTGATPVVMYPGDAWIVGEEHDSAAAVVRWQREYDSLASRPRVESSPVPRDRLVEAGRQFIEGLHARIHPVLARWYLARAAYYAGCSRRGRARTRSGELAAALFGKPVTARVWVTDHESAYEFDTRRGLRPVDLRREECDISLSAESLEFCFRFPWGGETLQVNGRFEESYRGARNVLLEHFRLGRRLYHGDRWSFASLARSVRRGIGGCLVRAIKG